MAEREGAVWFTASALGEDKDNVLVRTNGTPTYFASDIAYHYDKFVVQGLRPGDRHLGRRPPGPRAADEGHGGVPGHRPRAADPDHLPVGEPEAERQGGADVQAHGGHRHPARGDGRGGGRRRALLPAGPLRRGDDGLRPGPGQGAVQREPGVLRAVRPRPHRQHPSLTPARWTSHKGTCRSSPRSRSWS